MSKRTYPGFWYYERPTSFSVAIEVTGTIYETVEAPTAEDARRIIEERIENGDFANCEVDDVDRIEVDYVSANPSRLYLVSDPHGGGVTATSRPEPHHQPRAPDEGDTGRYGEIKLEAAQ